MATLALFDLDNTLVDRAAAFRRWAESFASSRSLDRNAVAWLIEADADGFADRTEDLASLLEAYHDDYPRCFAIDPATIEALQALRASDWKVGVVTNGPPSQQAKLEVTGLIDEVDSISISAVVGAAKPDRAIFEHAARTCGATLQGWMVGDTAAADIAGGAAAGLRTIWMSRCRPWPAGLGRPDAIVETIPEAVEVILS